MSYISHNEQDLFSFITNSNITKIKFILSNPLTTELDLSKCLAHATMLNKILIIELLLNASKNKNEVINSITNIYDNRVFYTCLQIACHLNNVDLVTYFLKMKDVTLDLNFQNSRNETALFIAIKSNNLILIKLLLEYKEHKASLELIYNSLNQTVIFEIINLNKINIFKLMLEHNVNLNHKDVYNQDPFIVAIKHNKLEIIKLIVSTNKVDLNQEYLITNLRRDKSYVTCILLEFIAYNNNNFENNQDIIKLLINKKINVNVVNNKNENALHLCNDNQIHVAKLLIEANINLNIINDVKQTPLVKAILSGNNELAKLLINNNADTNITLSNNKTLLQCTVSCYKINKQHTFGALDVFELLLTKTNKNKLSDLYDYVILNASTLLFLDLLNKQFNNMFYCSNLLNAVLENDLELVNNLLNKNKEEYLNLNKQDYSGNTVLYYALKFQHFDIARVLLKIQNINLCSVNNKNELILSSINNASYEIKTLVLNRLHINNVYSHNVNTCKILLKYLHKDVVDNIIYKYLSNKYVDEIFKKN